MRKSAIEAILSGKKTIETRFSQRKIPPFGIISRGDLIFMKPPGAEIIGQFRVKRVIFFDGLDEIDIENIFNQYKELISEGNPDEDQKYQQQKSHSSYASLIFIADSERFITSPIKVSKKDLRGWMVLS